MYHLLSIGGNFRRSSLSHTSSMYGFSVDQEMRDRLAPGMLYNCTIMELFLTKLQMHDNGRRIIFFTAFDAILFSKGVCKSKYDVRMCKSLLVGLPEEIVFLRHGSLHWWCEIYNLPAKTMHVYNSFSEFGEDENQSYCPRIELERVLSISFTTHRGNMLQQTNNTDCGPLVLYLLSQYINSKQADLDFSDPCNIDVFATATAMREHVSTFQPLPDCSPSSRGLGKRRELFFQTLCSPE